MVTICDASQSRKSAKTSGSYPCMLPLSSACDARSIRAHATATTRCTGTAARLAMRRHFGSVGAPCQLLHHSAILRSHIISHRALGPPQDALPVPDSPHRPSGAPEHGPELAVAEVRVLPHYAQL